MTVPSPYMNLPVPVVGVEPGPTWATDINACISGIDSHTHTAGSGQFITPDAIDVNQDLTFAGQNATTLRTVRFDPQATAPAGASDLGALCEIVDDLYFIDGAGNLVRITQGGSVTGASGTITGLPSGTASAAYSGGTFTFQSATNTPAAFAIGPTKIAQQVASGKGVTFTAAVAQAADYGYTLPSALPGTSSSALISDTSGNLTYKLLVTATDTVYGLALNPTLYYNNVIYNGVLLVVADANNFGVLTVNAFSHVIPYQTYDGSWNLRFRIQFTSTNNVSNGRISISGVSFKGVTTADKQACAAVGTDGPSPGGGYALGNSNEITIIAQAAEQQWVVSGDILLNSKPTWAS